MDSEPVLFWEWVEQQNRHFVRKCCHKAGYSGSIYSNSFDKASICCQILRNNCAGISEVNEPPFPYLTTIMRREFQPGLEEYLKTSTAGRKTLREIIDYFEANPETMLKYGNDLLRGALADTPRDLSEDAEYLKAMQARKDAIRSITDEISDYDAVLMTGPTYVMHFCGLPTITVAGGSLDTNSVRQAVILYGTDEYRLYAAALAVEQLLNSKA